MHASGKVEPEGVLTADLVKNFGCLARSHRGGQGMQRQDWHVTILLLSLGKVLLQDPACRS